MAEKEKAAPIEEEQQDQGEAEGETMRGAPMSFDDLEERPPVTQAFTPEALQQAAGVLMGDPRFVAAVRGNLGGEMSVPVYAALGLPPPGAKQSYVAVSLRNSGRVVTHLAGWTELEAMRKPKPPAIIYWSDGGQTRFEAIDDIVDLEQAAHLFGVIGETDGDE